MKEFSSYFQKWSGLEKIVIARVIKTWGSSPRPVGSCLVIDQSLNMTGSVSGGCVEGAVLKEAKVLFENGGSKVLEYGVTDDEAWTVGLSCGGRISVFLQVLEKSTLREKIFESLIKNESFIWLSKIEDASIVDQHIISESSESPELDEEIIKISTQLLDERRSEVIEYKGSRYFAHIFPRRAQMLIIGAAHISSDLIHFAKYFGFETIVIDPRSAFADKTSFADKPDTMIKSYPSEVLNDFKLDAYTYAVILSHDPKIDDNALQILLNSNVAYIGALGSKKTHAKRIKRLEDHGFTDKQIERIAAPIGIDIKAKTPREIALSIISEIIAVKNRFR